ncbi:hypothetical protein DL239_19840 [Sedimentitalea sp. CY04]|uniref:Uncharacterized protein n=1 Tax=Parasedimentitalea denitrificans TaxID=2211118 RepID=A0ABX0WEW2_9RHOB|nr:hypothetical protein [Sedimentitalea sp. CY04]
MKTRKLAQGLSRERTVGRASKMSPRQLTTVLRQCGYSRKTAFAAANVFNDVVEALRLGKFPPPRTNDEALEAIRKIKRIADKLI